MRVYPPPGPRGGDPIRPAEGGRGGPASLRVTVFQSGEAWREATPPVLLLLLPLSAVRGKGLLVVVVGWLGGGGALIGMALECFQRHGVLAAWLDMMQKNARLLNESQQCLSKIWTATRKTLCN